MVESKEGPTEPGSGPPAQGNLQPLEPPGTSQERTLPSATGQPLDPAGVAEQPGVQPSLTEAKPPPSPYLTPDFGKEDPFEILGKAMRYLPFLYSPLWSDSLGTPWPCLLPTLPSVLPAPDLGLSPAWWPLSSPFTVNRAKCVALATLTGRKRSLGSDSDWLVAGDSMSSYPAPLSLWGWQGLGAVSACGDGSGMCVWGEWDLSWESEQEVVA